MLTSIFALAAVFFPVQALLLNSIATHAVINMTSKFANHNIPEQAETLWGYGSFLFIVLVAGGFGYYATLSLYL